MVKVWELSTGKVVLAGRHEDWGRMVVFAPDMRQVVSVSKDWSLKVWDLKTQSCVNTWEGEPDSYDAFLSADGKWAAVGKWGKSASIIDVKTGKAIASWKPTGQISALYVAPSGSMVVWEASNQTLKAWHVQGKKYAAILEGHTGNIESIAVAADGSIVLSGGGDMMVRIWEVKSQTENLRPAENENLRPAENEIARSERQSKICPNCGLVNWNWRVKCAKCDHPLPAKTEPTSTVTPPQKNASAELSYKAKKREEEEKQRVQATQVNVTKSSQTALGEQTITIEAESVEEAKAQVRLRIPAGQELLLLDVIEDGQPQTVRAVANTTEEAFTGAQRQISLNSTVLDKKVFTSPGEKTISVEAPDEQSAKAEVLKQIGENAVIKSLKMSAVGKKGFLGIGKTPNQYQATVFQRALVEVTFKTKAKVTAKIGVKPKTPRYVPGQEEPQEFISYYTKLISERKSRESIFGVPATEIILIVGFDDEQKISQVLRSASLQSYESKQVSFTKRNPVVQLEYMGIRAGYGTDPVIEDARKLKALGATDLSAIGVSVSRAYELRNIFGEKSCPIIHASQ